MEKCRVVPNMISVMMTAETSQRFLMDGLFLVSIIGAAYCLVRWIERIK